ncbi:MAG TPA: hypothetical protein VFH48_10320 [Chloroflexota bacterium]|nr:hypothetical protein [Chloroflexota bacterium]
MEHGAHLVAAEREPNQVQHVDGERHIRLLKIPERRNPAKLEEARRTSQLIRQHGVRRWRSERVDQEGDEQDLGQRHQR